VKAIRRAPIGADPTGSFLKKLPKKASVIGMKGRRSFGKQSFVLCYFFQGRTVNTSFCWEGGTV
jgi:hypothetical protein